MVRGPQYFEKETASANYHRMTGSSYYNCVHCMTPSESTYRKFGREIKLTTCQQCGQNVDPYVEREGLLVAMDCILLREAAYCHVLCNRRNQAPLSLLAQDRVKNGSSTRTNKDKEQPANSKSQHLFFNKPIVFQYSVASALIQGYLLLQETPMLQQYYSRYFDGRYPPSLMLLTLLVLPARPGQDTNIDIQEETIEQLSWWIPPIFAAYSLLLGNVLFTMGIQAGFRVFVVGRQHTDTTTTTKSQINNRQMTSLFQSRISLAVILPTFFHVFTILVMIWENQATVRRLGSLLVLYYQYLMTMVAMQLHLASDTTTRIRGKIEHDDDDDCKPKCSRRQPGAQNEDSKSTISPALSPPRGPPLLSFLTGVALRYLGWVVIQCLLYKMNVGVDIPCMLGFEAASTTFVLPLFEEQGGYHPLKQVCLY